MGEHPPAASDEAATFLSLLLLPAQQHFCRWWGKHTCGEGMGDRNFAPPNKPLFLREAVISDSLSMLDSLGGFAIITSMKLPFPSLTDTAVRLVVSCRSLGLPLVFLGGLITAPILPAAVVLPDIFVTSIGSGLVAAVEGEHEAYFASGVDTTIGLGSAASAFFAGGPVAHGEQVSLTIKPSAGGVFSLLPGAEPISLKILLEFVSVDEAGYDDATPHFEFLDVQGGTLSNFTSIYLKSGATKIYTFGQRQEWQSDQITFSGIRVSWTHPYGQALNFDPMPLNRFKMFTIAEPFDTTPYLSIIPEPNGAILMVLGAGLLLRKRRRS